MQKGNAFFNGKRILTPNIVDKKISSRSIIGLKKTKAKTIKFLEENPWELICDLGVGKDFLDRTAKALSIKYWYIGCHPN